MERFLKAQERDYEQALEELKNGQKESHWMWYIFPQLKGLGYSYMADYYGLDGIEEARAFVSNPVLGEHLETLCNVLLALDCSDPEYVFGYPDNLKLCSSMTLFYRACPEKSVFKKVLDKYYSGREDERTLSLLGLKK